MLIRKRRETCFKFPKTVYLFLPPKDSYPFSSLTERIPRAAQAGKAGEIPGTEGNGGW
jgi:hypothetical protein